jgi:hypothetical protein
MRWQAPAFAWSVSVTTTTKTEPAPWYAQRRLLWLGAAAALFLVGAALWSYESDVHLKQRLRQEVRTQIPVGSNRSQVEQWAQRELGRNVSLQEESPAKRPPARTLADRGGVPRSQRDAYLVLTIPMGQRFINGHWGPNHMWVMMPLNSSDEVTGHYFLSLDELAEIEANDRNQAK